MKKKQLQAEFKHLEEKSYWQQAASELKDLRKLMFAALICAMTIVIGAFYITVGENLRVYFTFFFKAVGCAVYGPVVGVIAAIVVDTLNFLMFPSGPYFPGYMLGECVSALIFSTFLYRRKITVTKVFFSKLLVNMVVNVALGSLWSKILYGQGYFFYLVKSLLKNTLLLPLEVIALCALFSLVIPAFARFRLLPKHEKEDLRKLTLSSSALKVFGLSLWVGGLCSLGYGRFFSGEFVFQILGIVLMGVGAIVGIFSRLRVKKEES